MATVNQNAINKYKDAYNEAKKRGDKVGMEAAHKGAEAERAKAGYSGGADGSQKISISSGSGNKSGGSNVGNAVSSAVQSSADKKYAATTNAQTNSQLWWDVQNDNTLTVDQKKGYQEALHNANVNLNAGQNYDKPTGTWSGTTQGGGGTTGGEQNVPIAGSYTIGTDNGVKALNQVTGYNFTDGAEAVTINGQKLIKKNGKYYLPEVTAKQEINPQLEEVAEVIGYTPGANDAASIASLAGLYNDALYKDNAAIDEMTNQNLALLANTAGINNNNVLAALARARYSGNTSDAAAGADAAAQYQAATSVADNQNATLQQAYANLLNNKLNLKSNQNSDMVKNVVQNYLTQMSNQSNVLGNYLYGLGAANSNNDLAAVYNGLGKNWRG